MFKIIFEKYFDAFEKQLKDNNFSLDLPIGETPVFTTDSFSFYTSVSSVYSSKIEGEEIELDSYMKHRFMKKEFLSNYTKKIDDLHLAYSFARNNILNSKNILQAHSILTQNILSKTSRGTIRTENEYVTNEHGQIEYVATNPLNVKTEIQKLFSDIQKLLKKDISETQTFYFAIVIHLIFLKIHPFEDGNGRMSRLLEKWFLAQKLGEKAWYVPSEKYYYQNLNDYYRNLQRLGWGYESLNYDRCLPFLLMLPSSLNPKNTEGIKNT